MIAMGSPRSGDFGGGSILAYKYDDLSRQWNSYGTIVQGQEGEAVGYSVSLSDTGTAMAVGYPRAINLDGVANAGKAAVYIIAGSEWQLLGREIYGVSEDNHDGTSVAISLDGSVIVIGGRDRSEVNSATAEIIMESTGHCTVYKYESFADEWQFEHSIEGKAAGERLGSSVAISPDGSVVSCGGVGGVNEKSQTSGVVRMWNRMAMEESTIWPREEVSGSNADGSAFGNSASISGSGEHIIIGAPRWGSSNGASAGAVQLFSDSS